ncbi:hypothetical protein D9757_014612 [Collybiopsis confluens]|uniref:DUF6534 domain-containing protein n=1 Tax=Collybiopsis confluens TaxID=2823264 RepID=A0A8H5CJR9_9AGAR|nr:hypothetical protein D9757_014612 [Collybiopsis confluens]
MAFIPELAGEVSGNEMVGRNMMILLPRSFPNASSSADEFSALTDVPLFLGYMLSYILTGIMLVQVFLYYLYFRRKDPRFMKLTVLALFLVECISSVIATVIVIYSIITKGYLSFSILLPAFQALAILSGVATSMVHGFYCWRIHVLGGHWSMIVVIMGLSFAQCIMVSIIGSGNLDGDVLGSGTVSTTQPGYLSFNVVSGSAVCDIMIATSILYLQNRIMESLGKTSPLASRVERMMSVTIDTGMITAIGAGIELLLYLILRDTLVHFTLFYPLPKLYANCLMATLNARLATPDQGFRETTFITAELSDSEAADGYFKGPPNRQSLPTSIQIKVQEATTYRSSVSSSVIDIKRRSTSFSNESYPVLSFNAVATKRSSILDLKNVEPHYHDQDHSVPSRQTVDAAAAGISSTRIPVPPTTH